MDLGDLIAAKAGIRTEGTLTEAQQAARLKEHFESVVSAPTGNFKPGDILRHKYPKSAHTKSADSLFLFVRYLDKPIRGEDYIQSTEEMGNLGAAIDQDCILIQFIGDCLVPYLQNSRDYKPAGKIEGSGEH